MPVRRRPQMPQHLRLMKQHAARALHQGLDDDAGNIFRGAFEQRIESLRSIRVNWKIGDDLLRQDVREKPVHPFLGIADRHGRKCVAMIAAFERHKAASLSQTPD